MRSLATYFAGRDPSMESLFRALLALVQVNGPVRVLPEKARIALAGLSTFMAVAPRQMHMIGHFVLGRRVPNPRVQKIDTISPRKFIHHFCIEREDELDAEFEAWAREAYAAGQQTDVPEKKP